MNTTFSAAKSLYTLILLFATLISLQPAKAELTFNPQGFNFGAVQAGATSCHTVVLTNNSHTQSVTITGWGFISPSTELTLTPGFNQAVQLTPGQSLSFEVCYTPNGNVEGMQNALIVTYINAGHDTSSHSVHTGFSGSLHHDDHDTTDHDPHDSTDHDPHDSTDHNPHDSTDHDPHDSTNHHHCLGTHQGGNSIDPVVIGGTAEHTLYLINPTSAAITVVSATINGADAGVFTITSTLPITVPPNTTNTPLTYTFSPPAARNGAFVASITLITTGDSTTCQSVTGQLIGYPAVHHDHGNNVDSVIRPLFPDENRTLAIAGNGNHTSVTFYFENNLNVDVTVNNVYLEDGTYFTISSTTPSPVPFVLQPGARLTVVVTYIATDNHIHHDHLKIDASHQIQSISFDLQGVQLAPASVSNDLPEGVTISISPNPSKDVVKINMEGVRSSAIELVDLLGRTIATGNADRNWVWDTTSLTAGTYIVKIEGESVSGEKFILSKMVVIE